MPCSLEAVAVLVRVRTCRVWPVLMLVTIALAATSQSAAAAPEGYLVEFYGDHCPPCKAMMPTIDRLISEGQPIVKVNTGQQPDLVRRYRIDSVPTILLIVNDREVARSVGMQNESGIRGLLARIPKARPKANDRIQPIGRNSRTRSKSAAPVVRGNIDDRPRATPKGTGPLAASVRLRIRGEKLIDYGSGTVIDSRPGRTLIATCGHLFRGQPNDVPVEVEFFRNGRPETAVGSLVRFDLESDVGLVTVPTDEVWPTAPVASTSDAPRKDDRVTTVGCSGGADPTVEPTTVLLLNRWEGFPNVQVDQMPVQGRSGGGLFNKAGNLIGICMAADPSTETGMYAGLPALHDLLDDCKLTALYESESDRRGETDFAAAASDDARDFASNDWPPRSEPAAPAKSASRSGSIVPTSGQAASIGNSDDEGVEIVCIIRSKDGSTRRVVIIDNADADLLERIEGPARDR